MINSEKGFSLVELLIVIVIIGILATFAIPALKKAKDMAEIGNALASMKSMAAAQTSFYANNGRYGRLGEINNADYGFFGTPNSTGDEIDSREFNFKMTPPYTDQDLKEGFQIVGTKVIYGSPTPAVLTIDHRGNITNVY